MKKSEIVKFIYEHKTAIGFGNYDFRVRQTKEDGSDVASITVSPEFLKLDIDLHKPFYKIDEKEQKNTLLHELIHARVALMRGKIDVIESKEEEACVNDITKLTESVMRG